MVNLGLFPLWWYKGNTHSVKTVLQILNLDLFSGQWCHRFDAWGSDRKPQLSVSHEDEQLIPYSMLYCYSRVSGRSGVLNAFSANGIFNLRQIYQDVTQSEVEEHPCLSRAWPVSESVPPSVKWGPETPPEAADAKTKQHNVFKCPVQCWTHSRWPRSSHQWPTWGTLGEF